MQKNTFKKYKLILDTYSQQSGISVAYKHLEADAQWQPSNKTIYLHTEIEDYATEIANYLHELGHMRDDYTTRSDKESQAIERAYNAFNDYLDKKLDANNKRIRPTNSHKIIVLHTEYRAWINGQAIARQLGIRLGTWYKKQMDASMSNYFAHGYKDANRMIALYYKNGILSI